MKLIFIRHAEPDYEHDSLTEKGFREARLLAKRAASWNPTEIYVSPLGRAQATARPLLEQLGRTAETLPWLEEFRARVNPFPEALYSMKNGDVLAWDFPPEVWTARDELYDINGWMKSPFLAPCGERPSVEGEYEKISAELDTLIARFGYRRDGRLYRFDTHSDAEIVLVCHMAITFVMLSHLLGIPFLPLIQGGFLPPSSVSVVATEEVRRGVAAFRFECLGDVRHLTAAGEPVSSMGYFARLFDK